MVRLLLELCFRRHRWISKACAFGQSSLTLAQMSKTRLDTLSHAQRTSKVYNWNEVGCMLLIWTRAFSKYVGLTILNCCYCQYCCHCFWHSCYWCYCLHFCWYWCYCCCDCWCGAAGCIGLFNTHTHTHTHTQTHTHSCWYCWLIHLIHSIGWFIWYQNIVFHLRMCIFDIQTKEI